MRRISHWTVVSLATLACTLGCSEDFAPANQLRSVRVLATRSDAPYARPGEFVQLQTLAVDGRADRTRAMRVWYLPAICTNPPGDKATGCYAQITAGLKEGVDLSSALSLGDTFSFKVPDNLIDTHPPTAGTPYGVAYAFVFACAGHVQFTGVRAAYPDAPPFGCFDDAGRSLGSEDYVVAFARVYAYSALRNANPEFAGLTLQGAPLDDKAGVELATCTTAKETDCPTQDLDVQVADSVQEADPADSPPGLPAREQVWASYFLTGGRVKSNLSVLYDPREGRVSNTKNGLSAAQVPGDYTLYAVLHDNRGGVTWKTFPIKVR